MAMPARAMVCVLIVIAGCGTMPTTARTDHEPSPVGPWVMRSLGPELEVAVGFRQAARDLGDEWLILALEMSGASRAGTVVVERSAITAVAPDGRRLALVGQAEYRSVAGRLRSRVERALAALPVLGRYDTARMPCDRWFLADPFAGFAFDTVPVNTFQVCSGPLVFRVAGGIQPGRWRLVIELEESRVDIPFEIEAPG